jgi:hypothetical protein
VDLTRQMNLTMEDGTVLGTHTGQEVETSWDGHRVTTLRFDGEQVSHFVRRHAYAVKQLQVWFPSE